MQLDLEDVAYFKNILSKSDRADMKLFYLKRSLGDTFREEDPFGLGVKVDTQTAVDMRTLLQCARVVAADERTVWEYAGDDFFHAFVKVGDSWNEQLAAKVVYAFLNDRHEQDKGMPFALDAHMVAHIKPTSATAALFSGGRVQDIPAEGSVGVVPMVDGDAYSEGSIVCTAPLKAFDTLLRVPRSNMFFRDTVLQYSALGRCMASTLPLFQSIVENEEALLVLVLLYEKHVEGERSHWAPLLASCPPAYPTVPAYWSLTDLAEIEGVDVVDEVLSRKSLLQEFHAQMTSLAPLLFDSMVTQGESPSMDKEEFAALFTEDRLQWARTTFDSRAFNLNVDGRVVLSLVPYADMINHQNRTDALVRRVEPNGGDFVLQVGASVIAAEVGRELWMSYGPLQNWELLLFYGFVLEDNKMDKLPFPLSFSFDSSDEWDSRRAKIASTYYLFEVGRCWVSYDGIPCASLRALLRLCVAEADEFAIMEEKGPFVALSLQTELNIVDTIEQTVHSIEELFSTTLEEDEAELKDLTDQNSDSKENANFVLCLRLRIGLKRIAQRTLAYCEEERRKLSA